MRVFRPLMCLVLMAGLPVCAEPVPGADDPAFVAPFQRALQGDDSTALQDLYTAAEAGNQAALRVLPVVLTWLPPKGTLAERKRYRSINGLALDQAVAATSPVAAAWAGGNPDAGALDARALTLARAGEYGKAAALYGAWVNQYGPQVAVTPDLADAGLPAVLVSTHLATRLGFASDPADDPFVAQLLQQDRLEAWLALGMLTQAGTGNSVPAAALQRASAILALAGKDDVAAKEKMISANALRRWVSAPPEEKDPTLAADVIAVLQGRPEVAPLASFCKAACPATIRACEAAWLSAFSPAGSLDETMIPEVAILPTVDFFATARGAGLILQAPPSALANAEALTSFLAPAAKLDACLTDAARAVLAAQIQN